MQVRTTKGIVDAARLARTVGFEDRPDKMAVWVEWKLDGEVVRRDAFPLPKELGPEVYTTRGLVPMATLDRVIELRDRPGDIAVAVVWFDGLDLVRRDAHVIMKEPSVVASAEAAQL